MLLKFLQYQAKFKMISAIFITLVICAQAQIARDIGLRFLYLDSNRDNLLSTQQITNLTENIQNTPFLQNNHYYHWRKYETYIYPQTLFQYYDTNKDNRLSFVQFNQMVKRKLKRHSHVWPVLKGHVNVLNQLQTQDYLLICDTDKGQFVELGEFLVCLQAFLVHQFRVYPYKIKSMLYPNRTIGYSLQQFKQLLPQNKHQTHSTIKSINKYRNNQANRDMQQQITFLFNSFEWPQSKVPQDVDLLIGPYQGKFMQATMLYFYLDSNGDEVLDKQQALKYLKNHGGDQVFNLIDASADGVLDQAEVIAYFMFAMCIDDCQPDNNNQQRCKFSKDQESMFSRKHQTAQAICYILDQLQREVEKRQASNQSVEKQVESTGQNKQQL